MYSFMVHGHPELDQVILWVGQNEEYSDMPHTRLPSAPQETKEPQKQSNRTI